MLKNTCNKDGYKSERKKQVKFKINHISYVKYKTTKCLEDNVGENLHNLGYDAFF